MSGVDGMLAEGALEAPTLLSELQKRPWLEVLGLTWRVSPRRTHSEIHLRVLENNTFLSFVRDLQQRVFGLEYRSYPLMTVLLPVEDAGGTHWALLYEHGDSLYDLEQFQECMLESLSQFPV